MPTGCSNRFPSCQGVRVGKTRVRPFVAFSCSYNLLTGLVGYAVFPSVEALLSHRESLLPVVLLYVSTLPTHLLSTYAIHPIMNSQLLHKNSSASQDSEQVVVPQPHSPSHPLHSLVHLRNQQMLQLSQNLHQTPPKSSRLSSAPLPPQGQSHCSRHHPTRPKRTRPATLMRSRSSITPPFGD